LPQALAEKLQTAAGRNLSERRDVTVLFLDVTNFTATSRQLDNEDVYLFIDEAMALLTEVIHKYEGTIDKFTGDGLMALFGAPVAHENDPERAIRAAIEMQEVLKPFQARLKLTYDIDFKTRIGINTGPAVAGKLGSNVHMEYTVIGDTVNVASRLESAAQPDTILVSTETYQRTHPIFDFEPMPAFMAKGIAQSLQAYRVKGVLDTPGSLRGLATMHSPMIGRAQDLHRLQETMTTVQQRRTRQVAFITGEAGLGKSRMVAEFRQTLDLAETRVYQGNCLTYARSRPLWVVADLLRDLMNLSEPESSDRQRAQVRIYLAQLGLADEDLAPYILNVLDLIEADSPYETRLQLLEANMLQKQTHTALRQIILAEAQAGPLVLIFEDLHWVDTASRDFLEYLIQTTDNVPLMLILVSREAERRTVIQPLLAAAEKTPDSLVDVPLQLLSASDGQLLVDELIKEMTPEARTLKQKIVERAEGYPFYVEEIIRMLIDQAALVQDTAGGEWRVTAEAMAVLKAVPGTIKGLILARFDRLPEQVRQTLQQIAVLGSSFPVSFLQTLAGIPAHTLQTYLNELESRQFISAQPFRGEPGYSFRHALLQETIYSTLLKRDRRQIHTEVAQALQDNLAWSQDEKIELLAYHYAESNEPAKAIPYLLPAGKNAARRCAYETAIEHYRRALALLPEQPVAGETAFFETRVGLARALKYIGEFGPASRYLNEALEYLWQSDLATDSIALWPIVVESLRQLADIRQREGNYQTALQYLDVGLQVLGESAPQEQTKLWCSLLERMAWIRFRQGQLEEAASVAQAVIDNLGSASEEEPITLAKLFNTLGGIAWQQGRRKDAVDYVNRSFELYESAGYLWGMAIAYGNLGILYDVLGAWPKAAEYHERAYRLQQSIGDIESQARSFDNLGLLHLVMGEHSKAQQELEAGLAIRQRLGDSWGMAQSHVNLAHLAIIRAHYQEAARHAESVLAHPNIIESFEIQVPAHWSLALVQAEQGEIETGLALAEQALAMARQAGFMEGETDCLRVLGVIHTRMGAYTQAETFLRASADLSIKQNNEYRQSLALLELGEVFQRLAEADKAGAAQWQEKALAVLNEAAIHFSALGATYDLHLVQTAINQIQTDSPAN
jgi:class 3 adenylate cyclase/tetratricopeptide (TPR) repeat protein